MCGFQVSRFQVQNIQIRPETPEAAGQALNPETLKLLLRYAVDRGIVLENAAEKLKRRKPPNL